ncbi:MAG: AbrB family transcriptional regulator [Lawsonibacter sp.]|nr:AbrB family transcriptional regulator [Lawsonibacter sp.]
MWMLLTLAAALGMGVLVFKLNVPGGMLVGAILGAAALNIATGQAYIFPQARVLAQALTGAYIGCMMTREDVRHLPRLIQPYFFVLVSLLVLNLAMAAVFYRATDLDLLTCLFCAAPGGMSDTPLIAMDMGADGSVVAVMQFVRMIFGMGCLPTVILLSDRLLEPEAAKALESRIQQQNKRVQAKPTFLGFLPTMCLAMAAAGLGKLSGVPAGALSAALIVTVALKLSGRCPGMPIWLRQVAQVVSGCCIGSGITRDQIFAMRQLALPAVALCLGYIACCVGVGLVLSRLFHIPPREAMLTLSPAGATEMALIAADLGVESTNLVVLQICRLVGVMLIFPQIFNLVVIFLS